MNTVPHTSGEITPVTLGGPDQRLDSSPEASATVLLVDDEPIILDVLRELLHPTGHRIITATNGREALGRITHDAPDLMLLDLIMPRKNGREALSEIKADPALRRIPIVVMPTSNAEEDIFRTYDLGISSFIIKPVAFDSLVEIMKTLTQYWFQIVALPPASPGD